MAELESEHGKMRRALEEILPLTYQEVWSPYTMGQIATFATIGLRKEGK